MLAFNGLLASFMTAFIGIIHTWDNFQSVIVSINRLNDVFESRPEETNDKILLPPVKGQIIFDNVTFSYGGKKPTIKNLNLVVEPGEMVAIIGKSGCGKTTLMKLLLKMYPINSGSIKIDGYDINEVSAMSIRKQCGVVMQDSFLFSGTIRDNITCDNSNISSDTLEKVIKISGVSLFLNKLEKGYDTVLIERGKNLSGGQRQRVAIARALINNPRILIFDEATSALDNESEKIIQENIKHIVKNRTSFVIAHRLSTIRNADKIIVMDNGEIKEIGNHETLMEQKGLYYYLNSQQL
ncbi:ATP-binding cassette domain-containing protein [bacterium]|nr:MAG: ATP-binding cassette domain-containing protein [bacterium]